MKSVWKLLPSLALMMAVVVGCGHSTDTTSPGASTSQDQQEVTDQVASSPQYVEDGVYESEDPTATSATATASASQTESTQSLIDPINFWRHITDVQRTFEFAFSDSDSTGRPTRAVVTVHKTLSGTFNILASPPDSVYARNVIHKPLRDLWTRRILLRRVDVPGFRRPQWRVVATSGVDVVSRGHTTDLVSLRVQSSTGLDTTITHPLGFFRLRSVLKFEAGAQVTLTATTLRNDDVVVLQKRDRRFQLHNNGDNTYTGVFNAGLFAGVQHAGVNALSHGTLFDDQAAYDSEAWILPYVIAPLDIAWNDQP